MSGTLKIGGKTLATHNSNTNIAKIQLGSADDVVLTDSAGNSILTENGSVVTLNNVDTATIGSNALVVNSSGDVRIGDGSSNITNGKLVINTNGTTSPTNLTNLAPSSINLHSGSSGSFTDGTTGIFGWNASTGIGSGIGFIRENSSNWGTQIRFYTHPTNTNNIGDVTERMRIDSSGNVLLQKTSATLAGAGTYFEVPTTPTTMPVYLHFCKTFSGTRDAVDFNHNGTRVGLINFGNSSTSYNTSSDYRLKENITEITDGITRVKQLNPSRFNFIADPDRTVDGFIAHEVSDIVPEAISGEKDAVDDDGNPEYQGIDQSKLVPLLTAALQESIALIESQQSQIDALTARVEALEATP